MSPGEITDLVNRLCDSSHIYRGIDFYREVEKMGKWENAEEDDDSVLIWNNIDDAGPIVIGDKEIGLFVHYNEDEKIFDWACTYELSN